MHMRKLYLNYQNSIPDNKAFSIFNSVFFFVRDYLGHGRSPLAPFSVAEAIIFHGLQLSHFGIGSTRPASRLGFFRPEGLSSTDLNIHHPNIGSPSGPYS